MNYNLKGKVALITGGSRGIGKEICLQFAQLGVNVAINYTSSEAGALQVQKECESFGVTAKIYKADVASFEQTQNMVKAVHKEFGKIDILVNNAGITSDNLLMRMSEEEFDRVIDINLKGSFNCMKHVCRIMMKQKSGSIINMSSVVGIKGNVGQVNYAASKAGVIGMTKAFAREAASRGVRVNAVAPGFIATDMTDKMDEKVKEQLLSEIPLGTLGTVQDTANVVTFLASDLATYITGQVLSVDGGMAI